ncbi:hypothetical protein HMPREF2128_04090 [Pseudoglutamicibacter albus DNF00011]|uniref:Uncharacterized protein n=1 Tax=Pseudoglutamicibacter albus DNF00011 TaxID=1401063 RepID=A0A095YF69_9MICC|nr:hypothetical protein HMPREF2128_04090 [Pseudoglutamicibacter albus DNF00011]
MSVGDNLLCATLLIWAVLYWIYYVKVVRHPKNSWRYDDSGWCIRHLHLYPYVMLMLGSISAAVLIAQLDIPKFVLFWFVAVPMFSSVGLCIIAMLGAGGVPLPYPLVPKWFVKQRREEWARTLDRLKDWARKRRERRRLRGRK